MLDFQYTISTGQGGQPTPITLSLSANRTSGTAPFGVILESTATSPQTSNPYWDVHIEIDWGETGTYDKLDSDLPWGRSKTKAWGPVASHVYDTPGTYVATVTARDGVNPARIETITFTVDDPDVVFADANTAVISGVSDFTGAPSGASQYTTFAAAWAAKRGNANQRYLFKAGETFTTGGIVFLDSTTRIAVGRYGDGADPIIDEGLTQTAIELRNVLPADGEFTVSGLDIRGQYDSGSSSPVNQTGQGVVMGFNFVPVDGFKTIWDCTFSGVNIAVNGIGSFDPEAPATNIMVGNTKITEWLNYGIFIPDASNIGLSGVEVAQPGNTINGAGKDVSPYWPDHGPFRISRQYGPVCGNLLDLKSFNSWAASSGDRSMQPTFRINTGQLNQKISLDRIRSEGGLLSMQNDTGNLTGNPGFHLCDKFHTVLTDHPIYGIDIRKGGTTYRNGILVVPNTPAGSSTGLRDMTNIATGGNDQPGNADQRVEIYNCSLVDLRSDANASSRTGSQDRDFSESRVLDFTDTYVDNNLLYSPNMSTGGAPAIGVSLDTTSKWTVDYIGERWEGTFTDTTRAYGNEVTADFQPASTVAASGKTAIDDFYGNIRGGSPSQGAVEP